MRRWKEALELIEMIPMFYVDFAFVSASKIMISCRTPQALLLLISAICLFRLLPVNNVHGTMPVVQKQPKTIVINFHPTASISPPAARGPSKPAEARAQFIRLKLLAYKSHPISFDTSSATNEHSAPSGARKRVTVAPAKVSNTHKTILCCIVSSSTSLRSISTGAVNMKPETAIQRAPKRSESAPARGPPKAGIAMHKKSRPAGRAVQSKDVLTNKGSVAQRAAIIVSFMKTPYMADRSRGCRNRVIIPGSRLTLDEMVVLNSVFGVEGKDVILTTRPDFFSSLSFWVSVPDVLTDFA